MALISQFAMLVQASGHAEGGVPWGALAIQYVNLAILLGILWWALKERLPGELAARRARVEQGIEESQRVQQEARERHRDSKQRLDALDGELAQLKQRFEKEAEQDYAEILTQAAAAAERVLQDAQVAIRVERVRAVQALKREAARSSVDNARKLLQKEVDPRAQTRLMGHLVDELKSAGPGGAA